MAYYCEDCESNFTEIEQTLHEHENGLCPICGSGRIRELDTESIDEDYDIP